MSLQEDLFFKMNDDPLLRRVNGPNDMVLFNASKKLFSPKTEVQELAKGIVFDKDMQVLSYPLRKFYNWHEKQSERDWAKQFLDNMGNFAFAPKIDGTLIHVFYDGNQWVVTTRGSFDNDHIDAAKPLIPYDVLDPMFTYVFELVAPFNQVVTSYNGETFLAVNAIHDLKNDYMLNIIDILAINNLRDECQVNPNLRWFDYDHVGKGEAGSYDVLLKLIELTANSSDPNISEGWMIVFYGADMLIRNRIKVKTKQYIEALKALKQLSQSSIFQLCLESDFADENEFVESMKSINMPEEILPEAIGHYENYISCVKAAKDEWQMIEDFLKANYEEGLEKRFAILAKQEIDKKYHKFLFMKMRGRECSFKFFLESLYN